jgi:D-3-phosphoglycerate dehydrogenase
MFKILVSDTISPSGLDLLRNSNLEYEYCPDISAQELLDRIKGFDALIVRSRTKVTRDVIMHGTKLRVIGRAGVGVDNIALDAAKERGIRVLNTPDALTNAVAEFTIGLMIDLARSIPSADSLLKGGKWAKSSIMGSELRGKVYGTIGIGRIGARVAQIAYAMEMKILANDIIPIPETLVKKLEIKVSTQDEVLANSDFVDIHVPLTGETTHMINFEKLSRMKKTSFLINTARGKIVNESDLVRALDEGVIAGAALDVFEIEPPNSTELARQGKLILTPHIAGQTIESQDEAGRQIVKLVIETLGSLSADS